MPVTTAKLLTLIEAEIERFGNEYVPALRFEPTLEKRFQEYYSARRAKLHFRLGIVLLCFFDLFTIGDWFVIRDHFARAVVTRLLITTPIALVLLAIVRRNKTRAARETAVACLAVLACVSTLSLAFHEVRTFNLQAEPTVLIVMVILTGLLRAEFAYSASATTACVLLNMMYLASLTFLPPLDRWLSNLPIIAASVMMLTANWMSWRALRVSYLLQVRGEMQSEMLARTNFELRKISERDELTGMNNRYSYERHVNEIFGDAIEQGSPLSAVMVDVDFFKAVNDEHGHVYGDRVLQRVASLIQQALRVQGDFAARYGGEEFVVLLPETDEDAALKVAERIRTLVRVAGSPALGREAGTPHRFTTVSCGVATSLPKKGEEAEALIDAADRALYRAKQEGRNRVCVAESLLFA